MEQSIDRHLKLLQSQDVEKRKQAIVALGKSGNRAALKPLSQVYKTDSDPTLRELALKAGKHLQKSLTAEEEEEAAPVVPVMPPPREPKPGGLMFMSAVEEEAPAAPSKGAVPNWMQDMGQEIERPRQVSEAQKKKARSFVERALDAQVGGKREKVLDHLHKAIQIDPSLEKDGRVAGLIAMHLGVSSDQAGDALRNMYASGARKSSDPMGGEYHEILDFFIEMAIWLIVLGLFMAGGLYLFLNSVDWNEFIAEATAEGADAETIAFYQEIADYVQRQSNVITVALMGGFGYGAFVTIFSVIAGVFVWIVGMFLGGSGSMFTMVRLYFRAQVIIIIVSTVFSFLPTVATPGSTAGVFLGLFPLAFGTFYMAYSIGKAHEFGTMMGCVTMAVAPMVCGVLWCGLSFILAA